MNYTNFDKRKIFYSTQQRFSVNSPFKFSIIASTSGAGVQSIFSRWLPTATLEFHYNTNISNVLMNSSKGVLGESLMHELLKETGGWIKCSPAGTKQGIDGLFVKFGKNGRIEDLLVGEAKYGSSQLGMTKFSGKQMSQEWIGLRLKASHNVYNNIADQIELSKTTFTELTPSLNVKTITIPFENRGIVKIEMGNDGLRIYAEDISLTPAEISKQCKIIAKRLLGSYRPRLFKYKPIDNKHSFEFWTLDKNGNKIGLPQKVIGEFNELPSDYQLALRYHFKQFFNNTDLNENDINVWVDKCCKDPSYLNKFDEVSHWSLKYGPHIKIFCGGIMTGLVSFGIDIGSQTFQTNEIDYLRSIKIGIVSSISFIGATYTSIQLQWFYNESSFGKRLISKLPMRRIRIASISGSLSKLGGNIVGTAIFAYGAYALGIHDFKSANRQMLASGLGAIGGTLVTTGSMSLIASYGTASTGVAISQLSGAAAYNATLAWLGGGSIASGGGGMAMGTILLTGGYFIIVIAIASSVSLVFMKLDEKTQQKLIEGKLCLSKNRMNVR